MIPLPNGIRCAMRYSQAGLEAYNILNVLGSAPATSGNLVTVAGVFQTWWNTQWRSSMSSSVSWLGVDLTALDSAGSPFLAYTNTGTLAGGGGAGLYPPQVAIVASLKTGLSGRSFHGRIYVFGFDTTNAITAGLVSGAFVTAIVGKLNTLRTSLATAGFPMCVASYYSGVTAGGDKIPRAVGVATVVNNIVMGNRVDSQRRRLPVEARV